MRGLYRCMIRFHPREFQELFAEEMMCVFDATPSGSSRLWLIADGALSVIRQWIFRPRNWIAPRPALRVSTEGIPLLTLIEQPRPSSFFLLCGLILSTAFFIGIVLASQRGTLNSRLGLLPPFPNSFSSMLHARPQVAPFLTPAGIRLTEWMSVYNTGDAARLRRFASLHVAERLPNQNVVERRVQVWMRQFEMDGPFKLSVLIDESEPNRVVARVQAISDVWSRIVVEITQNESKADTNLIVERIH